MVGVSSERASGAAAELDGRGRQEHKLEVKSRSISVYQARIRYDRTGTSDQGQLVWME